MDDLNDRYQHLRHELGEAYQAAVWDSQRIDRIADEIVPIERALASLQLRASKLPELGDA